MTNKIHNQLDDEKTVGPRPPNILLILADDLGFGDLQMSGGHPTSETPNLNKLISGSKMFTNFYSASPVCSPSRYATKLMYVPSVFSEGKNWANWAFLKILYFYITL